MPAVRRGFGDWPRRPASRAWQPVHGSGADLPGVPPVALDQTDAVNRKQVGARSISFCASSVPTGQIRSRIDGHTPNTLLNTLCCYFLHVPAGCGKIPPDRVEYYVDALAACELGSRHEIGIASHKHDSINKAFEGKGCDVVCLVAQGWAIVTLRRCCIRITQRGSIFCNWLGSECKSDGPGRSSHLETDYQKIRLSHGICGLRPIMVEGCY